MKPRQFGPRASQEKKRIFVTLGKGLSYFISLVYTEHGLNAALRHWMHRCACLMFDYDFANPKWAIFKRA